MSAIFAALIATLTTWTEPAQAVVVVGWQAPTECPSAAALEAGIQRSLAGLPVPPGTKARARVAIRKTARGYRLDLNLDIDDVPGERTLRAESCAAAVDAAAWLVAIALDVRAVDPTRGADAPEPPRSPGNSSPPGESAPAPAAREKSKPGAKPKTPAPGGSAPGTGPNAAVPGGSVPGPEANPAVPGGSAPGTGPKPAMPGGAASGRGPNPAVPGGSAAGTGPKPAVPGSSAPGMGSKTAVPGGSAAGTGPTPGVPGGTSPGTGREAVVPGGSAAGTGPNAAVPGGAVPVVRRELEVPGEVEPRSAMPERELGLGGLGVPEPRLARAGETAPGARAEAAARRRAGLHVDLWAGGGGGLGLLPGLAPVAALGLALAGRRWQVELSGHYWATRRREHGAGVAGRFAHGHAAARGCGAWERGRVRVPLCAGLAAGAVTGEGLGLVTPRTARSLWVGLLAGAQLRVRLHRRVGLVLHTEAVIGLRRPGFTLEPSGDLVFRPAPVGFSGLLGLSVRLR